MRAAIMNITGAAPGAGRLRGAVAAAGRELISVTASALSQFSKSRSAGSHYSSGGFAPSVAGVDGVGLTADGRRVYFVLPEAPYGALAEKCLVRTSRCIPVPDGLDDVTAAAIANPGMSAWAALVERAGLRAGETVLVNGATGSAGRLAVQLAKYLGAGRVIGTGRNESALRELAALARNAVIPFALDGSNPRGAKQYEDALKAEFAQGIDVVIDYLWGVSAKTIIVAIAKAVDDREACPLCARRRGEPRRGDCAPRHGSAFICDSTHGLRRKERSHAEAARRDSEGVRSGYTGKTADRDRGAASCGDCAGVGVAGNAARGDSRAVRANPSCE